MTATTAYCTSNAIFYQLQVVTTKSQLTPILRLAALSPSSPSIISISHAEQQTKLQKTNQNDENNNQCRPRTTTDNHDVLDVTDDNHDKKLIDFYEEEFLACVGLRPKTKKRSVPNRTLRPLAKRLAVPICLLPWHKNSERVRQALYIVLPYLKFLSIIHDIENFCSTEHNAEVESFSLRSTKQTRNASTPINKNIKKHKMSRTEFIVLATDTFHNKTMETSMSKYVGSALHCQVALDRLDEFTIDQIMKASIADNQIDIVTASIRKRLAQDSSEESKAVLPKTQNLSKQTTTKTTTTRTTITTLTTEKTTVKHKSTANSSNQPKRLKTSTDDCICLSDRNSSASIYQRIYLKCFICSKREFIDAQLANSDILHSHWLEHDHDLSLNIYDSEIDSILTRVVEFFNFPKRHALEGKIQTVFILNSEEIRKTRSIPLSDDTCIVID